MDRIVAATAGGKPACAGWEMPRGAWRRPRGWREGPHGFRRGRRRGRLPLSFLPKDATGLIDARLNGWHLSPRGFPQRVTNVLAKAFGIFFRVV